MANSLKAKLSKLRHDGKITDDEYNKLISKLTGHDKEIRNKAIDDFVNWVWDFIDKYFFDTKEEMIEKFNAYMSESDFCDKENITKTITK